MRGYSCDRHSAFELIQYVCKGWPSFSLITPALRNGFLKRNGKRIQFVAGVCARACVVYVCVCATLGPLTGHLEATVQVQVPNLIFV